MRAHLVQLDIAWEDRPANYERTRGLVLGAGVQPGDLIVLPEMFDTGFSFNLPKTNDADGATLRFLQELARETRASVQGARTMLGPDGRGRNRATITSPDGLVIAEYDKIHPFSYGRESEFFSGGDRVVTYAWTRDVPPTVALDGRCEAQDGADRSKQRSGARPAPDSGEDATVVCPAICYDLRFPELFRRGLLMGAEVFAIGANWPLPRALHRRALTVARAIENQAFVLGVNRAGRDPHLEYGGGSMAIGPKGEVVGELGEEEAVLSVELDLAALREWRRTFPAWRDHRLLGNADCGVRIAE